MSIKRRSIVSPEDQKVTFVELFFDLVFVFSVTQIVSLFHAGITWTAVGQAILVFWLVWLGWGQFTWALNAADTTHYLVQLGVLIATGVALFMGIALPDAFQDRSLWFAVIYVVLRVIGLTLFAAVASEDPSLRAALRTWIFLSIGGFVAVLAGGYFGGSAQFWFWGLAIVLDIIATMVGGQSEAWNIHPEHFSERHGLFVIIALGETLIVAASATTDKVWSVGLLAFGGLAVAVTCALWWSYFPRAKPQLDHALASSQGADRSMMARDVFSLIHFPMLWGVIAYAAAVELAVEHPTETLPFAGRAALAFGLALFVGGMAVAIWRANGRVILSRVAVIVVTGIVIVVVEAGAAITLGIALLGVITIALLEQRVETSIAVEHG